MEAYTQQWFSDMAMNDNFLDAWELTTLDEFTTQHMEMALGQEQKPSHIVESYLQPPVNTEKPAITQKTASWSCGSVEQRLASPATISFSRPGSQKEMFNFCDSYVEDVKPKIAMNNFVVQHGSKRKYEDMKVQVAKSESIKVNTALTNREHVLSERRRREKLTERFISLSAIIPGLKKLDKASVLGDAIKYLKQLEEKVKQLEEKASKRTIESAVNSKKAQLSTDDSDSSSDVDFDDQQNHGNGVPEIEAKMSDNTILIKIHCENRKGLLVKVLSEIERSHLRIVNTNTISFATSSLDMTVITQIEDKFNMTMKDVIKRLSSSLRQND